MNVTVVIPSKTASNLLPCVAAVHEHEPGMMIIVVDDGVDWQYGLWPCVPHTVTGVKPFVFARNVNRGIRSAFLDAECEGVLLLNDDAILRTPGGFSLLARAAAEHPEYGLIAATCNNVGNGNQLRQGLGLREDPRQVCFVCVYIPRRTIDTVGLLDERFVDYGVEDDDYCLRIRMAGLKLGIHDGCFVDHGSLSSSYRGGPSVGGDFWPNLRRFIEKWGVDNFGRPA